MKILIRRLRKEPVELPSIFIIQNMKQINVIMPISMPRVMPIILRI